MFTEPQSLDSRGSELDSPPAQLLKSSSLTEPEASADSQPPRAHSRGRVRRWLPHLRTLQKRVGRSRLWQRISHLLGGLLRGAFSRRRDVQRRSSARTRGFGARHGRSGLRHEPRQVQHGRSQLGRNWGSGWVQHERRWTQSADERPTSQSPVRADRALDVGARSAPSTHPPVRL